MTDLSGAAQEFAELARQLKLVGADELHAELYKAINDAAKPLAREIGSVQNLDPYLPNRYAEILAEDLAVQISKLTGTNAGVNLRARGRRRYRHVRRLNEGYLTHPVFGRPEAEAMASGHGRGWTWVTQNIRAGFFTIPTERSAPQVRDQILSAMHRIAEKAVGR